MSIDEQWEHSGLIGKVAAGRYLIVAERGADGRRALYEAEDVEHGARVSLAVVHAATPASDAARLRSLRHPNLASILDAGRLDSGEPFLATELVRGTSLRGLLGGRLVPQRRALSIVREVLQALAAAHEVGAIHGDVKPEIIMMATDEHGVERARLSDLGVATMSGAIRGGDPRYRAPENTSGTVDSRTDLYSVGAILFELLTGHPPFHADDAGALIRMHAYLPIQTLEQRAPERRFTPELEKLVAGALAKNPDERFRSAGDMIAALDVAMTSAEAVPAVASAASLPQPAADDSLVLLAKDWIPVARPPEPPPNVLMISTNVSRQVRPLPWWEQALKVGGRFLERTRSLGAKLMALLLRLYRKLKIGESLRKLAHKLGEWVRKLDRRLKLGESLRKLDRRYRLIAGVIGGALVVALVIAVAARGAGARSTAAKAEGNITDRIDRVSSWTLDLQQATTCDERRAIISKLAGTADRRALPALRRVRTYKCVDREAAVAIQKIDAATKAR